MKTKKQLELEVKALTQLVKESVIVLVWVNNHFAGCEHRNKSMSRHAVEALLSKFKHIKINKRLEYKLRIATHEAFRKTLLTSK